MYNHINRFFLTLFFVIFLTNSACAAENSSPLNQDTIQEYYVEAAVLEIESVNEALPDTSMMQEQAVKVKVLDGKYSGQVLNASNTLSGSAGIDIVIEEGDRVILNISEIVPVAGGQPEIFEVYVVEKSRSSASVILLGIFMGLLILIGGIQGVKALVGLGLTGFGVFFVLLPALAQGKSPLLVTLPILMGVTLLTMLVVAGFSRKALAATLGTAGGLLLAGLLAILIGGDLASLQGLGTEEERMLLYIENISINTQGILFSGILLGALGAIMDVAMSVASAVEEVRKANPDLSPSQLTRAGMQVGRDVMGTMANTLILAYAGGALPFLVLYLSYQAPAIYWLNTEFIASEVLRAVAGSIGLIVSVPITAVLAGALSRRRSRPLRESSLPVGSQEGR